MDVLLQAGASAEQGQLSLHLLLFTHLESSCGIKKGWRAQTLRWWEQQCFK